MPMWEGIGERERDIMKFGRTKTWISLSWKKTSTADNSLSFSSITCTLWATDLWHRPPCLPGKVGLLFAIQDVTQSMCGGPDREAESTEKRKENKEREETEALRCAWYPISSQYPSREWKNTMNEIHYSVQMSEHEQAGHILDCGWEPRSNGGWIKAWKQCAVPRVSASQICIANMSSFLFWKCSSDVWRKTEHAGRGRQNKQ